MKFFVIAVLLVLSQNLLADDDPNLATTTSGLEDEKDIYHVGSQYSIENCATCDAEKAARNQRRLTTPRVISTGATSTTSGSRGNE